MVTQDEKKEFTFRVLQTSIRGSGRSLIQAVVIKLVQVKSSVGASRVTVYPAIRFFGFSIRAKGHMLFQMNWDDARNLARSVLGLLDSEGRQFTFAVPRTYTRPGKRMFYRIHYLSLLRDPLEGMTIAYCRGIDAAAIEPHVLAKMSLPDARELAHSILGMIGEPL